MEKLNINQWAAEDRPREKMMQIKTSQARQEGESAKLKAEADIAQAAKDKAVLEANYMQEQQTAQAKAELAHDIQSNITQKDVIQAQMDAELLKQQAYEEKLKLTLKRKMPISVAALTGIDSKQFFK